MQTPRPQKQHLHSPNLSVIILRDGGSSGPALITRLWYDGCEMASEESFDVGEKIKVAIHGMGSISAQVASTAEGTLSAHFLEEFPV